MDETTADSNAHDITVSHHDLDPTAQFLAPSVPPRRPRRDRRVLAAAAVVVLLGTGATALLLGPASSSSNPQPAGDTRLASVDELASAAPSEPAGVPAGEGAHSGGQGGGQAEPPAEPGVLAVSKNQIDLADGAFVGSFNVRNDGGSPLAWYWAGDPRVAVSQDGGTLGAGESTTVYFTVDNTVFPAGDFSIYNCVHSDESAKDVVITGKKLVKVNPGIQLPNPQIQPNS